MTAKIIICDKEYEEKFNDFVASSNGHIEVLKDPNLEHDPLFYERQNQLKLTAKAIEDGTMKMYDFNSSMDELIKELES